MALQNYIVSLVHHSEYITKNISLTSLLSTLAIAYLIYQVIHAAWNISPFHPLGHIPGPRLAAATYLPEFYYDVIKFGQYTKKIQQFHETYGPIVRISPNEVHCNDVRFADEIYPLGGRKRDKPLHQVRGSGAMAHAIFSTVDHDIHRVRRTAIAKFFSRGQVSRLEPKIHNLAQRLCDKILAQGKDPLDIPSAYSCFSTDVISDYCFGESYGFLDQISWEPNFRKPIFSLFTPVFAFRFFPFLEPLAIAASSMSKHLPEDMGLLIKTLTVDMPESIKKTRADLDAGIKSKEQTVFGSLLESDLPAEEKSVQRLTDEAASLIAAGTETVGWALAVTTYYLLSNPEKLQRLRKEISEVVDTSGQLPSWTTLEKLPYLGAVIYEGLRLSYGVSARTARVATEEDLVYHGEWTAKGSKGPTTVSYRIPRGFAVGMSSMIMHHNENVFPESHTFIPERWLDDQMQRNKELERSIFNFSKGSRACVGINLAFCELHVVLAALTMRVFPHMQLYETTEDDVRYDHDLFNPLPKASSKGIRAVIVSPYAT
ncbi:cytochrome P450 [Aspergillus caelatus]|uniref:Cytochrome P450 monooxygenase otaC n=1 Tax=Aspergillus caelatus TaxID=61420 RepID=A0A5N7AJ63_9EURO|nr:cytochrome P450 [Aspergillus caelatus]KAE8369703.1 cytochrome P450 [Aspergillus caelatus]